MSIEEVHALLKDSKSLLVGSSASLLDLTLTHVQLLVLLKSIALDKAGASLVKEALQQVLKCVNQLSAGSETARVRRLLRSISNGLYRALRLCPIVLDSAVDIVSSSTEDEVRSGAAFVAPLIQVLIKSDSTLYQDAMITLFQSRILAPRTHAPARLVDAFIPLLRSLPKERLSMVVQSITKYVKLHPDFAIRTLVRILSSGRKLLNEFVTEIIQALLPALMSSEASTRALPLELIETLVDSDTYVDDSASLLVIALADKSAAWNNRVSIASAITRLCAGKFDKSSQALSRGIDALYNLAVKEINTDAFAAYVVALGSLQNHLDVFKLEYAKLIADTLGNQKKPERFKSVLLSLEAACKSGRSSHGPALVSILPSLISFIEKVKTIPKVRSEALISLIVLFSSASYIPGAEKLIKDKGIWDYVFSDGSFLFVPEFLERLDEDLRPFLLQLLNRILTQEISSSRLIKGTGVYNLIVLASLNSSRSFRDSVLTIVKEDIASSVNHSGALVSALERYIAEPTTSNVRNKYLRQLLLSILSPILTDESIIRLLIIASQPALGSHLLPVIYKKTCRTSDEILASQVETILNNYLGPAGILHSCPGHVNAVQTAIADLVARSSSSSERSRILSQILSKLTAKDWFSLTTKELDIARAPIPGLFTKESKDLLQTLDIKPTIDWETEMKNHQIKKKGKLTKAEESTITRLEEFLSREREIREKVKIQEHLVLAHLRAVEAIIRARSTSFGRLLIDLVQLVIILRPIPEFEAAVESLLIRLSIGAFGPMRGLSIGYWCSTLFGGKAIIDRSSREDILECSIQAYPLNLEVEGFALALPILNTISDSDFGPELFEKAATVLANHIRAMPHPLAIKSLAKIAGAFPLLKTTAMQSLTSAASDPSFLSWPGVLNALADVLVSANSNVRYVAISTISAIPAIPNGEMALAEALWLTQFDENGEISNVATRLCADNNFSMSENYMKFLLPLVQVAYNAMKESGRRALASALNQFPESVSASISAIEKAYISFIPTLEQLKYDMDEVGHWFEVRRAFATLTLAFADASLTRETLIQLLNFFLKSAFLDPDSPTFDLFINAGIDAVVKHGKANAKDVLPLLEGALNTDTGKQASSQSNSSQVREGSVILMGTMALYLDESDPQVMLIVERLLTALSGPSESVRRAVAENLSRLAPRLPVSTAEALVRRCLEQALRSSKDRERRAGAWGLAGLTKGLKATNVLKNMGVMQQLQDSVNAKNSLNPRQGALYAFDTLSQLLGRLWEPYIIHILDDLLVAFGDKASAIRDAAAAASKSIMSQLSGHGIKLVLPAILKRLSDRNWRTKVGSIELLGAMAFCQPKQLAASLPTIIPELSHVLHDSHQSVQEAGKTALETFGKVIQNQEIQELLPLLIAAFDDPTVNTQPALEALMSTNFVHRIDPPSLSLIMPVVKRALSGTKNELKAKAAKIVGSMSQLTEHRDLKPYIEAGLMEMVCTVLSDPIPTTRAIAAKAIGGLVKGMGEEEFPTLVPWLLKAMESEEGKIERVGAAQGLAEVISSLTDLRFRTSILPEIARRVQGDRPISRQGALAVFEFLPHSWNLQFVQYLPEVLPLVTRGLADDLEFVREVALQAAQSIVTTYAETQSEALLPTLESGIYDSNWRIRQSAILLLGVFLRQLVGEPSDGELAEALTTDRGSSLLASLWLFRSDANSYVQGEASQAWKGVTVNTPKTLRSILPSIMKVEIAALARLDGDHRSNARASLVDLATKLSDTTTITTMLRALCDSQVSPNSSEREGAMLGLADVMQAASRFHLAEALPFLIPTIQHALNDDASTVQIAAAQAFDVLYGHIGTRVLDEILPQFIDRLEDSDESVRSASLTGLRRLLVVRSNLVLPFVIPKLVKSPLTDFQVRALAAVSEASGPSLNKFLKQIVVPLCSGMVSDDLEISEATLEPAARVILSFEGDGVSHLILELMRLTKPIEIAKHRLAAVVLLGKFVENSRSDYSVYTIDIITTLLERYNDNTRRVQEAARDSIGVLIDKIVPESYEEYLETVNLTLDSLIREIKTLSADRTLPGFDLPKGIAPLLPLYLETLRGGSVEVRSMALEGLRLILRGTSTDALKPYLIKMVGPLIRIFSEKSLATPIKLATIQTLNLFIDKGGPALKAAVTQIQTTYVKAISDSSKDVRDEAGPGLGKLLLFGARVEFILKELLRVLGGLSGTSAVPVLAAIESLLTNLTPETSPKDDLLLQLNTALLQYFRDQENLVRYTSGSCFGPLYANLSSEENKQIVLSQFMSVPSSLLVMEANLFALRSIINVVPTIIKLDPDGFKSLLSTGVKDKTVPIKIAAVSLMQAIIVKAPAIADDNICTEILLILIDYLNDFAADVKVIALRAVKSGARNSFSLVVKQLPRLIPIVLPLAKERKLVRVKFAGERALYHLLQIRKGDNVLKKFTKVADEALGQELNDYAAKTLYNLEDSDEEYQPIYE